MTSVAHRFVDLGGHTVFYREAGHPGDPTVVLLHGAPASSHMFHDLIPLLSDRYHLIAPDYLGFGLSAAPTVDEYDYTFDAIAGVVEALLDRLSVTRFAMYVQDYGAPVGWRLALRHPDRVRAIITQNGNAYEAGFVGPFWPALSRYAEQRTRRSEEPMRRALTLDAIRAQYLHGVPDPAAVSPESWMHASYVLQRPGSLDVQLRLFADYPSNVEAYPRVHDYFRTSQVPLLGVWGRHDPIFDPAGAEAFAQDLPDAEIHLVDGGHWLLESALDTVAGNVRGFLGRVGT